MSAGDPRGEQRPSSAHLRQAAADLEAILKWNQTRFKAGSARHCLAEISPGYIARTHGGVFPVSGHVTTCMLQMLACINQRGGGGIYPVCLGIFIKKTTTYF